MLLFGITHWVVLEQAHYVIQDLTLIYMSNDCFVVTEGEVGKSQQAFRSCDLVFAKHEFEDNVDYPLGVGLDTWQFVTHQTDHLDQQQLVVALELDPFQLT